MSNTRRHVPELKYKLKIQALKNSPNTQKSLVLLNFLKSGIFISSQKEATVISVNRRK